MITYPSIKFECQVGGKDLVAEVKTQVQELGRFNFTTRFSDGFEDIFSHDGGIGKWKATRDKKLAYLEKIKDDLAALLYYQPDRHYLNFRHRVGKQLVNIWVFETQPENDCLVYNVYYKGDYRFEMKKMYGAWYAKSVRIDPGPIDTTLVNRIGEMIDSRIYALH